MKLIDYSYFDVLKPYINPSIESFQSFILAFFKPANISWKSFFVNPFSTIPFPSFLLSPISQPSFDLFPETLDHGVGSRFSLQILRSEHF